MGLTIHWKFRFDAGTTEARRLVQALRERALLLPFDEVSDLFEIDAPDGEPVAPPHRRHALRLNGAVFIEHPAAEDNVLITVPGEHVIVFSSLTAGAESSLFGLATHPATVPDGRGGEMPTGLGEDYAFFSWCKTQYAGLPAHGGPSNFVRAHTSIVAVLDHACALGAQVEVHDDSGYFGHRDEARLLEELDRHNALIAALAGRLTDALGGVAVRTSCPIATHPEFEDLEVRGRRRTRTPPALLL